ncbi:hypothetical protein PO124_19035 [Bacillus licheniformis]|nr:hypothetical protein [Bacillus licheniformis]
MESRSVKAAYLSQDVSDLRVDQTVAEVLNLSDRAEIANARTIWPIWGSKKTAFMMKSGRSVSGSGPESNWQA